MRIHTETQIDIEGGKILSDEWHEYQGPVARCDRSLAQQAQNAGTTAARTASELQGTAAGVGGSIIPSLERFTTNPPGYSPMDLGYMKTQAEQEAAATSGKIAEQAKLRAMRTHNAAALGSTELAGAEAGARVGGSTIQDILARNAELKERQRSQAFGQLGDIYGTDVRGGIASAGQVPEDINAALRAKQTGWLQNLQSILGTMASLGTGYGNMRRR